jgi:hypothetical protein
VLWCLDAPATILGYWSWSAHQDYTIEDNPGASPPWKGTGGDSVIDGFDWQAGDTGLDDSMKVH